MDTSTHKPSSQFACISSIYINKANCASPSLVLLEKYSSLPFTNILLYNVVSIDGSHCKFQKVSSRDTVQTRFECAHSAHGKASFKIFVIFAGKTQIIYCVDSSAPEKIGNATINLIELLHQPSIQTAPVLILFTKTDLKAAR